MPKKENNRRRVGKKPQRKKFLIVLEGTVTEPEYIGSIRRSLRLSSVSIVVENGNTDPIGIVNAAKERRRANNKTDPFDQVWCVFDVEAKITQRARYGLEEVLDSARRASILVAASNPCFEIWLLWHKEDRRGWTASDFVQRRCQEIGITHGKDGKHIQDVDGLVRNDYNAARARAYQMEQSHSQNQTVRPEDRNPSSDFYRLIEAIFTEFLPKK